MTIAHKRRRSAIYFYRREIQNSRNPARREETRMPERLLFTINGNGESRLPTFPVRASPSSRQGPFILNGYFLAIP
jgi:hypothetical protein